MARTLTSVWPPLAPTTHLRRPRSRRPYPLDAGSLRLFARARHGLNVGLQALGIGPGDCVLMPAWHHGSEVEAVLATGAECTFYEAAHDLGPDAAELQELATENVRALHVTHYLGFPQDAGRWRRWCDDRGLLLVEDAAQAWLASCDGVPVGSRGDLAVWCLYKTYGLPDGAAMRGPGRSPPAPGGAGVVPLLRRHAAWAAQLVPIGRPHHERPYDAARDFALGTPSGPSRAMQWLLPRVLAADAVEPRRRTYRSYLDVAGHLVPRPFDLLPAGAVPFAFPVAVSDKPAVLAAYQAAGVHALDLWSVPHPALPLDAYPRAAWFRRHLVALPVHQGLTARGVRQITAVTKELLRGMSMPAAVL